MVEKVFSIEFEKTLALAQTRLEKKVDQTEMVDKVEAMRKSAKNAGKQSINEMLPKATISGLSSLLLKIGQIASLLDNSSSALTTKLNLNKETIPAKVLGIAASKAKSHVAEFETNVMPSEKTLRNGTEKLKDKKGIFHSLFSGIAMVFSLKAATVEKKGKFSKIDRSVDQAPPLAGMIMFACIMSFDPYESQESKELVDMVQEYLVYVGGLQLMQAEKKAAENKAAASIPEKIPSLSSSASGVRKNIAMSEENVPKELKSFYAHVVSIEHQLDKIVMHINVILINVDGLKLHSQDLLSQLTQILSQLTPADEMSWVSDVKVNQELTQLNQTSLDHQQFCQDLLEVVDYTLEIIFLTQQAMNDLSESENTGFTPQMESLVTTATSSYTQLFEELTGALVHLGQDLESLQEASTFDLQ